MASGFLVVNTSTVPELGNDNLLEMLSDVQLASDRDFCPEYGLLSVPIALGAAEDTHRGHTTRIVDYCDDPSAVADHTRDAAGFPVLQIGAKTAIAQGGVALDEISKALSHEIWETLLNPYVALWTPLPDGRWQAFECADPVQGDSYRVRANAISAFVTRAYWDPDATGGPFAVGSTLPGPLTVAPHGYRAFADGSTEFGERVDDLKRATIRQHGRVAAALRGRA